MASKSSFNTCGRAFGGKSARLFLAIAALLAVPATSYAHGGWLTECAIDFSDDTKATYFSSGGSFDPSSYTLKNGDVIEIVANCPVGAGSVTSGAPNSWVTFYGIPGADFTGAWITDASGTAIPVNSAYGGDRGFGKGAEEFGNAQGLAWVYGDTGIFFSTSSATALYTGDGTQIATAENGYSISPTNTSAWGDVAIPKNATPTIHNLWDRQQSDQFGASGGISAGRGATPFGQGSPVAGADSGVPNDHTGSTGPWSRISYVAGGVGSCIASDPGSDGVAISELNATGDASNNGLTDFACTRTNSGYALSASTPLPSGTTAVRFSLGRIWQAGSGVTAISPNAIPNAANDVASDGVTEQDFYVANGVVGNYYVKVQLEITDRSQLGYINVESAGGDAAQPDNTNDNPWRYFVGATRNLSTSAVDLALETARNAAALTLVESATLNDEDGSGGPSVGDTIDYTFTVSNPSDSTISDITLSDSKVTVAGGPITSLTSGSSDSSTFTATYTLTQADIDAGKVANSATVTGDSPDGTDDVTDLSGTTADDDIPTEVTLPQTPILEVVKTADSTDISSPAAGVTVVSYTISATNTGNVTLSYADIADTLTGAGSNSLTPLISGDSSAAPYSDGEIDVGETWEWTVSYTVSQDDIDEGMIENVAAISVTPPGGTSFWVYSGASGATSTSTSAPSSGNGVVTYLGKTAAVTLVKTATVTDVDAQAGINDGDLVTYSFEVTNTGNVSLENVAVADKAGDFTGSGAISTPSYSSGDTDSDSELDVGESWIFTATYTLTSTDISSVGYIENQASVNADVVNSTDTVSADSRASASGAVGVTTTYLGAITGVVEENRSPVNGATVNLLDGGGVVIATTTTNSDGEYIFTNVQGGGYSVQFEPSGGDSYSGYDGAGQGLDGGLGIVEGIVMTYGPGSSHSFVEVNAVVIDPSGVIYDSATRLPLAGASVSLLYNGSLVDPSWLAGGSNTVTTGVDGVYAFLLQDPAEDTFNYSLQVTLNGYTSPSVVIVAQPGAYTPALGGGFEDIVTLSTAPQSGDDTTYYTSFDFTFTDWNNIATLSNGVTNNHIPLDLELLPLIEDDLISVLQDDLAATMTQQGQQMNEFAASALDRLKSQSPASCLDDLNAAFERRPVHFDTDKAIILRSSEPVLDEIAEILQTCEGESFEIAGHTDNRASDAYNIALSQARVMAVIKALETRGVDADYLIGRGYGERRPIADNATPEGMAANRRVEFRKPDHLTATDTCVDSETPDPNLFISATEDGIEASGAYSNETHNCDTNSWRIVSGTASYLKNNSGHEQGMFNFSLRHENLTSQDNVFGRFVGLYATHNNVTGLGTGTIDGFGLNAGIYGASRLDRELYFDYYVGAAAGRHNFDLNFPSGAAAVNALGHYTYFAAFAGAALSGETKIGRLTLSPRIGVDLAWSPGGNVAVTATQNAATQSGSLKIGPISGARFFGEVRVEDLLAESPAALAFTPRFLCDRPIGVAGLSCGYGGTIELSWQNDENGATHSLRLDAERTTTFSMGALSVSHAWPVGRGALKINTSVEATGAVTSNLGYAAPLLGGSLTSDVSASRQGFLGTSMGYELTF